MAWAKLRPWVLLVSAMVLSAPAHAGRQEDRAALRQAIEDALARTALSKARIGLQVLSLDDGSVVFAKNAEDLLNPASNVKLFTSAAALRVLGPEYRFETEFLIEKPAEPSKKTPAPKPGEVRGNLYVRGKGDPSITDERLWAIAGALARTGLKVVTGDLVLDESWFDAETIGPGYDQERGDRAYLAPAGALSLNYNAVGIYVTAGDKPGSKASVEVDTPSDFFVIENRVQTAGPRALRRLFVSSVPAGDKQRIVVSGRLPAGAAPTAVWRKIDSPTFYFGHTLARFLGQHGVQLKGKVRRGAAPEEAQAWHVHQSETLDLVLKRVNKNSSNFTSEQLIKTMGAVTTNQPGSWAAGIAAVEEFLATEIGIPRGTFVMKNGSGLNDTNRFSAAQIAKLLRQMWLRFPLAPEYLSSLGIAGKDGTLHYRMSGTEAEGRLRAKTGTLENVSAMSGYVEAVGGERFVFAIVANDFPGRTGPVVGGIDAVGAAIAGYGRPNGPADGLAKELGPTPAAGTLAELKERIATYRKLSAKRGLPDLTFLRTAMKAERDPALKAVLAESIFRAEPDEPAAARMLVDAFDSGPEVFGRLRQLAREQSTPVPLLGSLSSIAAEGNVDALARLVEVAAQAKGDELLAREMMEPLAEVTRNAPEEIIVALRAARDATKAAALDLIAKSLVSAAEPDHPFPVAVRRTMGSVDPQLALFAKGLEEDLSVRIAAEKLPRPQVAPAKAVQPVESKPADIRPGG